MDQPARDRRGAAAEIVLLQYDHAETAQGRITRDRCTVDPGTDDGDIVDAAVSHQGLT